jgi:xanthine dehydrogenase accessory factor
MDLYAKLHELASTGRAAALCTIVRTSGSTPRKAGSKLIVTQDEKTFGSIGGGKLEKEVIADALSCIAEGKTSLRSYSPGADSDGQSYGEAEIFIDPLPAKHKLYIFGAGHVGQAVASLAIHYGFEVSLIDHREELMNIIDIKGINKFTGQYIEILESLPFDKKSYILVMTNTHASDEEVTFRCAQMDHAYLGMIGSKKKVAEAKASFAHNGLDQASIDKIDMPVGIPINCETPAEIAISIMARLIDTKNA